MNVTSLKTYNTLRGHRGEVYTVAALNSSANKDESSDKNANKINILDRIIFTAGEEGIIKVWQVPPAPKKEDKYPPTNDQSN